MVTTSRSHCSALLPLRRERPPRLGPTTPCSAPYTGLEKDLSLSMTGRPVATSTVFLPGKNVPDGAPGGFSPRRRSPGVGIPPTATFLPAYPAVRALKAACAASLTSLHNETANIWSHLVPALVALAGNYLVWAYFDTRFPGASWPDRAIFHVFLTGSVLCFGVSAAYHAMLCHSQAMHDLWLRMDYLAIVVQILGSFLSGIYMGFYCETRLRGVYWTMIGILSLLTCIVVLHPRLQSKEHRILRLGTFVATGLSGFAPIIHAATMFPYAQLDKQAGIRYYYLEGVFLLIGAYAYAIHYPEKWHPVKFDIWGASHQIFHCSVVLAAVAHFYGLWSAYTYNYANPRCS
ncbi:adiponectin receptor protein [Verticillium alfalfae VaMs.102]|uniref:Adiponectin receptor protein n=1 Tax=Verticillium alfalfae (strain VaMs.102 / ATCC MYA-4576 / FGSC 10136) TaxID=526221 RepID=C9S7G5_VERA1|nr:adiponectin receptor protein [Verticillium alfalfae VaMs.102]EEY14726.1 adiponectin receptor protein [Verticillium alfalfae VaMs.102]